MYIARILYPVEVLGPGKRVGIWFNGCNHQCKGCSNPELWQKQEKYKISIQNILELISRINKTNIIEGFTITGGEPIDQYKKLSLLVTELSRISSDILLYTGYTLNELKIKKDQHIDIILSSIAVLIDGKYVEELNNNSLLRGSSNQTIHILNKEYINKYSKYLLTATNQIQNFVTKDGIISVGIHKPNFFDELNGSIKSKGLREETK